MLTELSDLQSSDESVYGTAEVSFTIRTRTESAEIVERAYTFSHAPEWDKWMFSRFEERKREERAGDWRRSRSVTWDETEAPTIEVPPEVEEELKELLDLDELTLQEP